MAIIFGLSLTADVLLAIALLKLAERVNELVYKVEHIELTANSQI